MANVIIHCHYSGKEGAVRGFFDEMRGGVQEAVRAEDGCLQYDYFLSAADGERGVLLEKWRDRAALKAHQEGAAMAELLQIKAKYGIETTVEVYDITE